MRSASFAEEEDYRANEMTFTSTAALTAKSPILGTSYTVNDIATTGCKWNSNWFAVNMSHPAAQPWLDSVYGQYAEWGIDLIKNDCIFAGNDVEDNIKAVSVSSIAWRCYILDACMHVAFMHIE